MFLLLDISIEAISLIEVGVPISKALTLSLIIFLASFYSNNI